jgi:hypothetical protein
MNIQILHYILNKVFKNVIMNYQKMMIQGKFLFIKVLLKLYLYY